jgi:murein DD-endopeptidase MepM/ murein hydrolase activator NlpD
MTVPSVKLFPPRYLGPARGFPQRFLILFLPLALFLSAWGCGVSGSNQLVLQPSAANVSNTFGLLHRVAPNETLSLIAGSFQRDFELLVRLNQIPPPYAVREGEYLYIPPRNDDAVLREGTVTLNYIRSQCKRAELRETSPHLTEDELKTWAEEDAQEQCPPLAKGARQKESESGGETKESLLPVVVPSETHSTYAWPVAGRYMRGFTTGWRRPHKGVDIAAPRGEPVRAARGGRVLLAKRVGNYGQLVVIAHPGDYATLYAHLSQCLVSEGQMVKQNQYIGRVGCTGRATGPHLHFEIRRDGAAVDPEKYLPSLQLARK